MKSKVEQINTSEIINNLSFDERLKEVFEKDTNWNKSMIKSNQNIKNHYIAWLEAQLYLMKKSMEHKDRYAEALKSQRSRLLEEIKH